MGAVGLAAVLADINDYGKQNCIGRLGGGLGWAPATGIGMRCEARVWLALLARLPPALIYTPLRWV
jgi:hypothetical protein